MGEKRRRGPLPSFLSWSQSLPAIAGNHGGKKTQPTINQGQWGGTRQESGRCVVRRPLQANPTTPGKVALTQPWFSLSLSSSSRFFGKTARCLIELNVAYFRLRFPAHLGANVDITSIPLDAVIGLSSCYNLDSGGKAAAVCPIVGLSHAKAISGCECCFLMCFSRDIKHTCTFAIGPGNKAIILQTRHFTRIKPHVSSYISMTVLRLLCSYGLCDNYFSKLDAAFLPWGVATCGQSRSQLMILRMKKLTWWFEEKVESGVFKLKETQGIISSQL